MWKHLFALVIILLISVIYATPVMADTTADVTITASGYILDAPILTVTWISDKEIRCDWIMAVGTANVTLRAKYGSAPTSRTDGYWLYTGNATTYIDTSMNLDESAGLLYYRIWGQNAVGIWEETGDIGFARGVGMLLIALIVAAMGLTGVAFWQRRPAWGIAGGAVWFVITAYAYTLSTAMWDIYFGLYVVSAGIGIISMMEGWVLKPKEEKHEQMMDDDEDWKAWEAEQKHFQEKLDVRRKHKPNI